MDIDKKEKYCIRYLAGEMSESEMELFEAELRSDSGLEAFFEEYKAIWDYYPTDKKILNQNKNRFEKQLTKKIVNIKRSTYLLAASVIVLLLSISTGSIIHFSHKRMMVTIAEKGQRITVWLPDSSQVIINSGGKLKYPRKFHEKKREVWLTGEAFFDVKHDDALPFYVHTEEMDVKVLGTSFNVNTITNEKEVSLVMGKVKVRLKENQEEIVLKPNEQLVWNTIDKAYRKQNFDTDLVTSWKNNFLKFNNIELEKALIRINQFYGVNFRLGNNSAANQRIKGTFKNLSLNDFISTLEFIGNFKIKQVNPDNYLITKKNGSH